MKIRDDPSQKWLRISDFSILEAWFWGSTNFIPGFDFDSLALWSWTRVMKDERHGRSGVGCSSGTQRGIDSVKLLPGGLGFGRNPLRKNGATPDQKIWWFGGREGGGRPNCPKTAGLIQLIVARPSW